MPFPKGRSLPLSPARRLMCDLMHFSRQVPLVSIERRLELAAVAKARQALPTRPSWFALFLKAFGNVARRRPAFRRSYLPLPWPHLYEHGCNVASLPIERSIGAEDMLLFLRIRDPESLTLAQLQRVLHEAKHRPVEEIGPFRSALRLSRLPRPLRRLAWRLGLYAVPSWRARYFGTFGLTAVSGLGSASLHFLTPLTSTLSYGVLDADGSVVVRLAYDHRVLDGVEPARALEDLEEVLNGPIVEELLGLRGLRLCAA
jgi:hypothetical protein